jgi:pyruvyltransferase
MSIKLKYYSYNKGYGNFGDELSKFIVEKISNTNVIKADDEDNNCLIAVGSYLHKALDNDTIWGTGIRTYDSVYNFNRLNIYAVRGPLTKKFLEEKKILTTEVIGDPTLLLPKFYSPNKIYLNKKITIIPHITNYEKYIRYNDKYNIIDPTSKWSTIIDNIYSSDIIISASLHGIILADAYNIPNIMINQYFLEEGTLKFLDYYLSQNREFCFLESIESLLKNKNKVYDKGNIINTENLMQSFPKHINI